VFQVLEGFPEDVEPLYQAIAGDPRHGSVVRLISEPIAQRSFGDWSMGQGRATGPDLGAVPALRPLLDPAFRYWHCDPAMAHAVVAALTTGPWRRSIG
jgi:hypothetical protein